MSHFEFRSDREVGNKLIYVDFDQSWVEKVRENGNLYWCKNPAPEIWENISAQATKIIKENFLAKTGKLGIAQSLAEERMLAPFTLPPMFTIDDYGNFLGGTGMSRMVAEIMCATPVEDLSMIILCNDVNRVNALFDEVVEIRSTPEYEQLFNIENMDYTISWKVCNNSIMFLQSIVNHSIYEIYKETDKYFVGVTDQRLQFLTRFFKDDDSEKIKINIFCDRDQEKFFTHSDNVFEVKFFHQPPNEWAFSYGKLMAEFRPSITSKEPKLNIWAFDIQEPVNLYILLMWASMHHYAYYTKNRKLTVFDPSNIASIKEIPNLVK